MKYVLVTGSPRTEATEAVQMEVISEDGTTVICNSKNNYPENAFDVSAAVTDGTTIVACGGSDSKFF